MIIGIIILAKEGMLTPMFVCLFVCRSVGWLNCWLVGQMIGWLIGRLVDLLVGWLVGRSVSRQVVPLGRWF